MYTIADFISTRHSECASLFTKIISVCYSQGLIDKDMFAINGCKISPNCSKEWSGVKEELLGENREDSEICKRSHRQASEHR